MSVPQTRLIARYPLPWGKEIAIEHLAFDTGLALLRLRFREGSRFTVIDLDPSSAASLAETIAAWTRENYPPPGPDQPPRQ